LSEDTKESAVGNPKAEEDFHKTLNQLSNNSPIKSRLRDENYPAVSFTPSKAASNPGPSGAAHMIPTSTFPSGAKYPALLAVSEHSEIAPCSCLAHFPASAPLQKIFFSTLPQSITTDAPTFRTSLPTSRRTSTTRRETLQDESRCGEADPGSEIVEILLQQSHESVFVPLDRVKGSLVFL
jgi:hypothetical protein